MNNHILNFLLRGHSGHTTDLSAVHTHCTHTAHFLYVRGQALTALCPVGCWGDGDRVNHFIISENDRERKHRRTATVMNHGFGWLAAVAACRPLGHGEHRSPVLFSVM